ncbi:ATP-binding protein (plasmid) [Enterobacter bugandensis]|uniref:ATP-binding protein n=1 Tax=Enterobacter bugandensis TaxID=881260 RepID=UPI00283A8FE7|nr:ATP-binding protein [Enterobacter bugandensis]WMU75413.1 ATP-binding protein [Enterobacter bugandensis]
MSDVHTDAMASLGPWLEYADLVLQGLLDWLREHDGDPLNMAAMLPPGEGGEKARTQSGDIPYWMRQEKLTPWLDGVQLPPLRGRLAEVVTRFALTPFETQVLILSALPLFDTRYGAIISYIQRDSGMCWPGSELLLTLFSTSHTGRIANRLALFSGNSILLRHQLVLGHEDSSSRAAVGEKFLRLNEDVFHFLCGEPAGTLYTGPGEAVQWRNAETSTLLCEGGWATCAEQLDRLCFATNTPVPLLLLQGGPGREALVTQLAQAAGRPVLRLDLAGLPGDESGARRLLYAAVRAVRLYAGVLLICDRAADAGRHAVLLHALEPLLAGLGQPVIALLPAEDAGELFPSLPRLEMTLPPRTLQDDVQLLSAHMAGVTDCAQGQPVQNRETLLRGGRVDPDTLSLLWQEAQGYRMLRAPAATLELSDLRQALHVRGQQQFKGLVQRIRPQRTFDDLIVGDRLDEQLREILAAVHHRKTVLEQGFSRKVGYGTGISALFHGPSGTGKTMAAEVLAGELGVDLIRVDLSTVVNKYIGETEKNLSRIFDLATADTGVLLFDEADALFGKRSEVKDARDRHANIEVSYLLQRLEQYPGLVVLTSNNRSHLDNAFSRRLTFITRFEAPDESLRERMWRAIWPAQIRVEDNVDWARWAAATDLTGAGIRNVAMLASWLAASAGRAVSQSDITRAVQRELDKTGKLILTPLPE